MSKKKIYFDADTRQEKYEEADKQFKALKESWTGMTAPRANGNNIGDQLKSKQGVTGFAEAEDDIEEPIEDMAPENEAPPEPISTDEPEVSPEENSEDEVTDSATEEKNMETQSWIDKSLSNVPTAGEPQISPEGIFKITSSSDSEAGGKVYNILVWPEGEASLSDAVAFFEPEMAGGDDIEPEGMPDVAGEEIPNEEPAPEPTETDELNEEDPDFNPVSSDSEDEYDYEDGGDSEEQMTSDDELLNQMGLEESEEKEDEDEEMCEGEECDEQKMYESQDPASRGKKDWKAFMESRYGKR